MDIEGRPVSIVFNCTTHVCEAFVIVIQYIKDWVIQQKVCRLMLLAKAVTGEEVDRQVFTVISTELSVPGERVIAAMSDRASLNNVAMCTLSIIYHNIVDVGCFSHTLDNAKNRMNTLILNNFSQFWISLFSHSAKT